MAFTNNNLYNNLQTIKPNYNNFIIEPPEKNKTHKRISDKLVIDSRDRNYILYPGSHNYQLTIDNEYNDVVAAELILAQIPNSGYNIHDGNNQLLIHDHKDNHILIKLKNGEYTNSSLINYLNGSKGNILNDYNNNKQFFNFYLDPDTNKIKIKYNKKFIFNNMPYIINTQINKCNNMNIDDYYKMIEFYSIDKTLGFKREIHDSIKIECISNCDSICDCDPNSDIIIQESVFEDEDELSSNGYELITIIIKKGLCDLLNLYSYGDYIDIGDHTYRIYKIINSFKMSVENIQGSNNNLQKKNINNSYKLISNNVFNIECPDYVILDIPEFHSLKSDNNNIHDSFCIIPLNTKCKTIIDSDTNLREIKFFNPPLPRLSKINIRFKRYDGSDYDFNGKEHMLMFNIYSLNQPGKYNI